jgi:hypothetical protein
MACENFMLRLQNTMLVKANDNLAESNLTLCNEIMFLNTEIDALMKGDEDAETDRQQTDFSEVPSA